MLWAGIRKNIDLSGFLFLSFLHIGLSVFSFSLFLSLSVRRDVLVMSFWCFGIRLTFESMYVSFCMSWLCMVVSTCVCVCDCGRWGVVRVCTFDG